MTRTESGAAVRVFRALLWLGGLTLAANACIGGTCTLVGCENAVYIDLGRSGPWREGAYSLELSFDGESRSCDFVVPDDLPSRGRLAPLDCGDGVEAFLGERSECTSTSSNNGNSGSGSCSPIAGEYELSLELAGNPKTVSVQLSRDGLSILSDSREPKYEREYPNGPDCGAACTAAGYDLTFDD